MTPVNQLIAINQPTNVTSIAIKFTEEFLPANNRQSLDACHTNQYYFYSNEIHRGNHASHTTEVVQAIQSTKTLVTCH
jgi:hypothetical protein